MEKLINKSKYIELNEVVHYYKRLEKFHKSKIKTKIQTNQDNNREFNNDKWGGLIKLVDVKYIFIENAD